MGFVLSFTLWGSGNWATNGLSAWPKIIQIVNEEPGSKGA